jgi:hypothetical protein
MTYRATTAASFESRSRTLARRRLVVFVADKTGNVFVFVIRRCATTYDAALQRACIIV